MSDFLSEHIIVINVPVPKGSQPMTTTRTTARAEIYDAAINNGFNVKVDEGIEMTTLRRSGGRNVSTVTRFVITRKPEFASPSSRSLTVVFSETDAFVKAWRTYGGVDTTPWRNARQRNSVTKTEVLHSLINANPERLLAIKAEQDAARREAAVERYTAAHNAVQEAVGLSNTALDNATEMLRNVLNEHHRSVTRATAEAIVQSLLDSGVMKDLHEALNVVQARQAGLNVADGDVRRLNDAEAEEAVR